MASGGEYQEEMLSAEGFRDLIDELLDNDDDEEYVPPSRRSPVMSFEDILENNYLGGMNDYVKTTAENYEYELQIQETIRRQRKYHRQSFESLSTK